jgi:hypothetical protein
MSWSIAIWIVLIVFVLLFLYSCVWVSRMAEDSETRDGRWRL